jgi:hypothetical protein
LQGKFFQYNKQRITSLACYDLSKEERIQLSADIHQAIAKDIHKGMNKNIINNFADEDTYIRKAAYQAIRKIDSAQTTLQL